MFRKQPKSELALLYEQSMKHRIVEHEGFDITFPGDVPRTRLRPSSFPICSILVFLKLVREHHIDMPERSVTLFSDFFTSVGTMVHHVVQRWMAHTGKIVGDWECPKCGHKRHLKTYRKCSKCGTEMRYEELTVTYKGLTGHVDGLFKLTKGGLWVVDYKTTSVRKLATKDFHSISYKMQILCYAYILKHVYGLPIKGASLLYIARDNPSRYFEVPFPLSDGREKKIKATLNNQIRRYRAADRGFKTGDIETVIRHKPCQSRDHYFKSMHGYDECPLLDVCFNRKELTKSLERYVKEPRLEV
jgi:hypothetical protein